MNFKLCSTNIRSVTTKLVWLSFLKIIHVCGASARLCHDTKTFVSFVLERWNVIAYFLPPYVRHCGGWSATLFSYSNSTILQGRVAGWWFFYKAVEYSFHVYVKNHFFPHVERKSTSHSQWTA
jgi:hypothetical protein